MYPRLNRARRAIPVSLGVVTLAGVGLLLVWDVFPRFFPANAHDVLAAFPLVMIAVAYLVYQAEHRPAALELVKAILLVLAFPFWAANQFWPNLRQATLFNDIAIALFVFDVFLVIVGWPEASPDESFAETFAEPSDPDSASPKD
jgi:MFS superfamily sulfate permease-like transporter